MNQALDIVVTDGTWTFKPAHYNAMRRAIAACATIDDCAKEQSRAAALAVYFREVNDKFAQRALEDIRLRAWRRMAEIIATVDVSKCASQKLMVEKIRHEIGADATSMLTNSRIIQLIKLAGIPASSFEAALERERISLASVLFDHPDKIRKRDVIKQDHADYVRRQDAEKKAAAKAAAEQRAADEKRADDLIALVKERAIIESPDVGLTLNAKASAKLVSFSVMMDRRMHDQLRDAAHERRTTMWAILREAANYWFVVNGFDKV